MISPEQVVLRLVVAVVLGGLVGLERERLEWAAGMRTHALVSLGSALFMVVSIFGFSDILAEQHVILDPSRVAAQVASGIGFIGAGTIILRREIVKGLTTAASIWAVAAVGLAVGGGMFLASVAATLLALAILVLAKPVKKRIFHQPWASGPGASLLASRLLGEPPHHGAQTEVARQVGGEAAYAQSPVGVDHNLAPSEVGEDGAGGVDLVLSLETDQALASPRLLRLHRVEAHLPGSGAADSHAVPVEDEGLVRL
jgi:hypothetical protein